jgi:hypothetical protein
MRVSALLTPARGRIDREEVAAAEEEVAVEQVTEAGAQAHVAVQLVMRVDIAEVVGRRRRVTEGHLTEGALHIDVGAVDLDIFPAVDRVEADAAAVLQARIGDVLDVEDHPGVGLEVIVAGELVVLAVAQRQGRLGPDEAADLQLKTRRHIGIGRRCRHRADQGGGDQRRATQQYLLHSSLLCPTPMQGDSLKTHLGPPACLPRLGCPSGLAGRTRRCRSGDGGRVESESPETAPICVFEGTVRSALTAVRIGAPRLRRP